jgi:uncharacterized protein YdiU (UPF0061 family)
MTKCKPSTPAKEGSETRRRYSGFKKIDGRHPLRDVVPGGYVDYPVRTRHGGRVFYFNFELAREMGLISRQHENVMNRQLEKAVLDTFSLVIVNEYDVIHKTRIRKKDLRPNKYMATRYLQLQHPNKQGKTSGDGRSIWNGYYQGKDAMWDVSSCGTGATRLSPACAIKGEFFKTGDDMVSYGCGRAELLDGVAAAIMSEIFHRNEIATERTLAVIDYGDGTSVNVRAAKNLLRPAHFFMHLKQGNYDRLKGAVDLYIARQVANGDWKKVKNEKKRYKYLLEQVTRSFARAVARFESEYIFCWLDWDGDNILSDAGIIDFGSVRQFGLYHDEYRYDDDDRMSTTITEQKSKAKYTVQTFAQMVDFLVTGEKKPVNKFNSHSCHKQFDRDYQQARNEFFLYRLGYPADQHDELLNDKKARTLINKFRKVCLYFEKAKSARGRYEVSDGISWDAIFCVRDIFREMPQVLQKTSSELSPEVFLDIIRSTYAEEEDLTLTPYRRKKIQRFQALYKKLLERAASLSGLPREELLNDLQQRSSLINRYERITGDAIIYVAQQVVEGQPRLTSRKRQEVIEAFIESQVRRPEYFQVKKKQRRLIKQRRESRVFRNLMQIVRDYRYSL